MKTLQSLLLLALLFTLVAWFSLQGVSQATSIRPQTEIPLVKDAEPVVTRTSAPVHQTGAALPKKPQIKPAEVDTKPSPLQIALQAGDICETAKLLSTSNIPQPEVWKAILATIQPGPEVLEAYGPNGPMLAATIPGNDDPKAGKVKYAHLSTQFLWALKMGGMLYAPISPAGDNARAAREIFLELQKKEPGNAVYPLFRLAMEEKLGYSKEQLKATTAEISAASTFDTHMSDIGREIHEATWISPAVHYAISYCYSSWGSIAFDSPLNSLQKMSREGDFDGSASLARLMTEAALHSSRTLNSGDFDPSQYAAGRNLDPENYKDISALDAERVHGEVKYAPGLYTHTKTERTCNPGLYEAYFYEVRDAR